MFKVETNHEAEVSGKLQAVNVEISAKDTMLHDGIGITLTRMSLTF